MHYVPVLLLTSKAFECMTTALWVLCAVVLAIAASYLGIGLRRRALASHLLDRSAASRRALPSFVNRRPDLQALLNEERDMKRVEPFCVSGLTKTEAEELLDWLEGHGCVGAEVSYLAETGFVIRHG